MRTLSIVIPVFNEARTIAQVLDRVRAASTPGFEKELVVVDDGSTDGTREYLAGGPEPGTQLHLPRAEPGQGRRPAHRVRRTPRATWSIVQDADLEYDPARLSAAAPSRSWTARPTSSSARASSAAGPHRVLYFWHSMGNRVLTLLLQHVHEPEPHRHGDVLQGSSAARCCGRSPSGRTASASSRRSRPRWPGSDAASTRSGSPTRGRTYEEGKKITWRDGVARAVVHRQVLVAHARLTGGSRRRIPPLDGVSPPGQYPPTTRRSRGLAKGAAVAAHKQGERS